MLQESWKKIPDLNGRHVVIEHGEDIYFQGKKGAVRLRSPGCGGLSINTWKNLQSLWRKTLPGVSVSSDFEKVSHPRPALLKLSDDHENRGLFLEPAGENRYRLSVITGPGSVDDYLFAREEPLIQALLDGISKDFEQYPYADHFAFDGAKIIPKP